MARTISKIAFRVARMSWDELHTRVGQLVNQRTDLLLHRLGVKPARYEIQDAWQHGTFFFSRQDLESRTNLLKDYLPSAVEEIVKNANEICKHRFCLLGYDNVSYGTELDWHLDPIHGKRAPLRPWFKIPFLDFSAVGDHKIIWELNRHQHLMTLAKAWRLTQEERYLRELLNQWYSWQQCNPSPMGINWASSLEVAFRSLSWLWVRYLTADASSLPARFETDLQCALALNGTHIEKYLSTYFSPNTHLLGEAVALFFLGTSCPQLPAAVRWCEKGWNILLREAERQVRPDGVYFEQSLYYHVYALDFLVHARVLAARSEIAVPKAFDAILERMLDVVAAVTQAGPDSFGDDDGGRVFDPRRNRAEHLRDPLTVGSVLFPHKLPTWVPSLTEEAIWLFGQVAISALNAAPVTPTDPRSACFQAGGLYVMANANVCPEQAIVDAGPQGVRNSGHGHADALSLRVSLAGRQWLVDPGTYCYVCSTTERDSFRGTGAHNTLQVDNQDQAIAGGPFTWRGLPNVHCEQWLAGHTFSAFRGSHTGYKRLSDQVIHRRQVFHLHGSFWLVHDIIEGSANHELEIFWHFASNLQVKQVSHGFVASLQGEKKESMPECLRLAVLPLEQLGWGSEITSGFVSPVYGKKEDAPVLRSYVSVKLPTEQATLLLPLIRKEDEVGSFTKLASDGQFHPAYEYAGNGRTHRMCFAPARAKTWHHGPFQTDASFLYYGLGNGKLVHLIACDASYLKMKTQLAFAYDKRIERMECIAQNDNWRTFSTAELPASAWLKEATVP
jgi:hypothetical protein